MKTRNKALLLTFGAVLLVAASVLGTLAYLTSTDKVVNTFTVGNVKITLDEADVKTDGTYKENQETRVEANEYHLLPGHSYIKDPTVHVDAASEDCYVFVKVENGISAYEAATSTEEGGYKNIADQITANGWVALKYVTGVYYKEYTKSESGANLVVFEKFKIADEANKVDGWTGINPNTTKIEVTAYAVQKDGFETASVAWTNTFGKPANP